MNHFIIVYNDFFYLKLTILKIQTISNIKYQQK